MLRKRLSKSRMLVNSLVSVDTKTLVSAVTTVGRANSFSMS